MNTDSKWVIDATMGIHDGMFCFCPIEFGANGEVSAIVTGMNFIGGEPPRGKCIGVIHEDGQDAVDAFCAEHRAEVDAFFERQSAA